MHKLLALVLTTTLGWGMAQGSHTLGHVVMADHYGVQLEVDAARFVEVWDFDATTPDRRDRIHNAGFVNQDRVRRHFVGTPLEQGVRLGDAVFKVLYVYGVHSGSVVPRVGDYRLTERDKGHTYGEEALLLSAALDILKAFKPDARWDMRFWQSSTGAPGLMLSLRSDIL
jgi:hypothetical protein